MSTVPNYALYGENPEQRWFESLHYEPISRRAKSYKWKIQPHQHDALIQLLFVEQGSGTVFFDGNRVAFRAPCFILIPARTVHGFDFNPGIDGSVVTAAQSPLESLIGIATPEMAAILQKPTVTDVPAASKFTGALQKLFELIEYETLNCTGGEVSAAIPLLVALLVQVQRLAPSARATYQPVGSRKAEQVERFRALVNDWLGALRPVEAYSDAIGVTAGQLRRICKEVLGQSPLELINARIIHAAQRDLAYSTMSVQQVAESLGFDDAAYFSRFYRKQTGLTPSEFRERVRTHQPLPGTEG
ncbi:helix-turn-helix domain-containing protein [Marinobacterium aestuariivivens]|uniref:Helix-turn-helix domain-containing protein n=1 Tax=Marinobacterium aestuariivivens TaxID=1698799 RepID=A0ABW2A7G1_9GAMM